MVKRARTGTYLIFGLALVYASSSALAQENLIRPERVVSSETVERALKENSSHATSVMKGQGARLDLTYTSQKPVTVFLVPLNEDNSYVITDFIWFLLPAINEGKATVDLTVSTGWSQGERRFLLNLLSSADPGFELINYEFIPTSAAQTIAAAFRHFFIPEFYTPSSFHALRGIRLLGMPVAVISGMLLLITCIIVAFFSKPGKKTIPVFVVLIIGIFIFELRFSFDLLRFSVEHRSGYISGDYDEAGSVYQVSAVIKEITAGTFGQSVYVCRDGTNFKEKLLRYFSYPVKVSSEPADFSGATLAVVMNKYDWQYDANGKKSLTCGKLNRKAELIATFPDDSRVFKFFPLSDK